MRKIIKPYGHKSIAKTCVDTYPFDVETVDTVLDLTNTCVYDHYEIAGTISFKIPPMDVDDIVELFQDGLCGLLDHIYGGCDV